jgi:hypothetical protein
LKKRIGGSGETRKRRRRRRKKNLSRLFPYDDDVDGIDARGENKNN